MPIVTITLECLKTNEEGVLERWTLEGIWTAANSGKKTPQAA